MEQRAVTFNRPTLAQSVLPSMVSAGKGALIVTGNTAAWRAGATFIIRQRRRWHQLARLTCTRLSENEGACPISVNSAELMLLTVPSLSCRQ